MATEQQPERQPDGNRGSNRKNTRGVQEIDRPGRPNPFGVQWPEFVTEKDPITGEETKKRIRKTLFFPTAAARDAKAKSLRDQRKSGMMVVQLTREEVDEYRAIKGAIEGTPWQEVVAGWRAFLMQSGLRPCTITVATAGKVYMDEQQKLKDRGAISADTFRQKRRKLELFVDEFGSDLLDSPTKDQIEDWIDDIEEVQSDITFDDYKKHLRTFYNFWIKEKKAIRLNPAAEIKFRSDGIGEVHTISVAQTAQLFHTALITPQFLPMIGRLALEAFLGLRFGSGCRLEKADINFADKGVTLPKFKLKTKRRHYVDGMPENLWGWLAITPEACWSITPRQYLELKSRLFIAARVPHPRNCLRHGFCTYHIAAFKNPGLTAVLLCHRDQVQLWEHYKGNRTEAEGKLYQTITPQTCERLAQGFEPAPLPAGLAAIPPAAPQPVPV